MGTQMMADELRGDAPRTVDNAWLFGSAGVTEQTADALAHLPGDTDVYATHAERDWVAPFGRFGSSEHAANPLDVQGIHSFSSEGGEVRLPGGGSVHGEQVGGHNTRLSDSWVYRTKPSSRYAADTRSRRSRSATTPSGTWTPTPGPSVRPSSIWRMS
jgi:hypothetical protein